MFAKKNVLGIAALFAASLAGDALALPGDLDTGFADHGKLWLTHGTVVRARQLADGRIVAHEETTGCTLNCPTHAHGLARFLADGRPDVSFGVAGRLAIDWQAFGDTTAVAVRPDGRVLVAGTGGLTQTSAGGVRDTVFGVGGQADVPFSGAPTDPEAVGRIADVLPLADGRLLVIGRYATSGTTSQAGLAMLTSTGALDGSFGIDGVVHSPFADQATAVVVAPNGRLFVAGGTLPSTASEFALAAFLADGRADTAFGQAGVARTRFGADGRPTSVAESTFRGTITRLAMQEDGKLLAAGELCRGEPASGNVWCTLGLVRYLPNGSLDSSFHNGAQPGLWGMVPLDLHVLANGKILVAVDAGIARFNADGTADVDYANAGLARTAFPSGWWGVGAQFGADARVLYRTGVGMARYLTDNVGQGWMPASGLWVVDDELGAPGRGFQIEVQRDLLMLVVNGYEATGAATFHVAGGSYSNNRFSGQLTRYAGGTPTGSLPSSYRPAHEAGSAGPVDIQFTSRTRGIITLPGEPPKALSKFEFGVPPAQDLFVAPLPGLWIIDQELGHPGRGFLLEAQQQWMVMIFDGYQASGEPTFYFSAAPITNSPTTQWASDLGMYAGGRYFGGSPRDAHYAGSAGVATMRLSSGRQGYLSLPGEASERLFRKFDFGLQ